MELISFFLLADKSIKQPLFCKDNSVKMQNSRFWNAKQ